MEAFSQHDAYKVSFPEIFLVKFVAFADPVCKKNVDPSGDVAGSQCGDAEATRRRKRKTQTQESCSASSSGRGFNIPRHWRSKRRGGCLLYLPTFLAISYEGMNRFHGSLDCSPCVMMSESVCANADPCNRSVSRASTLKSTVLCWVPGQS